MKLPRPKTTNEIFYTKRIGNKTVEQLLDFGIRYSIGNRQLDIASGNIPQNPNSADRYLNQAILKMKKMGFCQGKIMKIISSKMNKVKFGVEIYRVMKRAEFAR